MIFASKMVASYSRFDSLGLLLSLCKVGLMDGLSGGGAVAPFFIQSGRNHPIYAYLARVDGRFMGFAMRGGLARIIGPLSDRASGEKRDHGPQSG